jgi:hypothetical protein
VGLRVGVHFYGIARLSTRDEVEADQIGAFSHSLGQKRKLADPPDFPESGRMTFDLSGPSQAGPLEERVRLQRAPRGDDSRVAHVRERRCISTKTRARPQTSDL